MAQVSTQPAQVSTQPAQPEGLDRETLIVAGVVLLVARSLDRCWSRANGPAMGQ